jgi:hypothetical protein
MGAAASSVQGELPDRLDLKTIDNFLAKYGLKVEIDIVRFNLLKDATGTVSRTEALQLIENKLPPIYSVNAML